MTLVDIVMLALGAGVDFQMYLVALAISLAAGWGRWRHTAEALAAFWSWLMSATNPGQDNIDTPKGKTLLDQVVEIRDRVFTVQQRLTPADIAIAGLSARLAGVLSTQARVLVGVSCLRLAVDAVVPGTAKVTPPCGSTNTLGDSRRTRADAWFAAVRDSLTVHDPKAAAANG